MKKPKTYPKPIRIEIEKGKQKIVKDKTIIIKPVYRN